MNTLDILILLSLAGGLVVGLRVGLIKQVLSFVGLILAFVLSLHLMKLIGQMATDSMGLSEDIAPLLGFVLVFTAVQVGVFGLIRLLHGIIGALRLSGVNRVLGGAVGAFKASLSLSVAFLVLGSMNVPSQEAREGSAFYKPMATMVPATWDYVAAYIPQFKQVSEEFGKEITDQVAPAVQTGAGEEE
jgi:membrane protein required for colicin V production